MERIRARFDRSGLFQRVKSACLGIMSPQDIDVLVRLAGLEDLREKFPDDVAEAAALAAAIRAGLPRLHGPDPDESGEPWPPMFKEDRV